MCHQFHVATEGCCASFVIDNYWTFVIITIIYFFSLTCGPTNKQGTSGMKIKVCKVITSCCQFCVWLMFDKEQLETVGNDFTVKV